MKVKFILPALTEAKSIYWRSIKYSLFPPLGLATLASFLDDDVDISLEDEHVEPVNLFDCPDIVFIQSYITNAYRSYAIADHYRRQGIFVVIGGLHATSLPFEAKAHADSVLLGLGEGTFKRFIADYKSNSTKPYYYPENVCFNEIPLPRRDLINNHKYLVPNSIVFSRGCPCKCSFCYVNSFFKGQKKSFYTYKLDRILKEIDSLNSKHLYFLDDNLLADKKLAKQLFIEMSGMGKVFQGAITIKDILDDDLVKYAYDAGLRSAFIGFESLDPLNLKKHSKYTNLGKNYDLAIKKIDELNIMINGSFIFGMENDNKDVFKSTTNWALEKGITTATFHILTPYPGTSVFSEMKNDNLIFDNNWNNYDTRHLVFKHPNITKAEMEKGYKYAYTEFYKLNNIYKNSKNHETFRMRNKHLIYSVAWKKIEPLWNLLVKNSMFQQARKILELTLK